MIEVYIRHSDEEAGTILGNFSPDQIRNVVSVVKEFGIYIPEMGKFCSYREAQFTEDLESIVFEIIVD